MKTTFRIKYDTCWGESLCIVAGDRRHDMHWVGDGIWEASVNAPASAFGDYTYMVMEDGLVKRTEWEHHSLEGRRSPVNDAWNECPIEGCAFKSRHIQPLFDRPGYRAAGVAVPVFALRSESDFGIGEFRDLHPLVDWAASVGMSIIQLLPVSDTTRRGTWKDSYPYSPVSAFALNPMYIHLQDLGIEQTDEFKALQAELNALPEIDYPRVFREKSALVRKAWLNSGRQSSGFKRWKKDNSYWLDEYCSFCARRDGLESDYFAWVQWQLETQFAEEADYARSRGISLKGDLPIGISADSAEACFHPELFNLDSCAGAPPDFFSSDGQNWGFPTYNWEAMEKDCFAWWKARLRKMSRFFDAYRIDHILGFFRIWEIPAICSSGRDGHFNPALPYSPDEIKSLGLPLDGLFHEDPRQPGMYQPLICPDTGGLEEWQKERFEAVHTDFFYRRNDSFWRRNALRKLPALLGATGMLACGEDLGMVPDCVGGVMEDQRILSLEMACMQKGRPWPYLSVCATSSHDMETLRMQHARCSGGSDMEPWQVRRALSDHLESASMLAIFPIQDWVALDGTLRLKDYMAERINEPSDPDHHWRYRFHLNLSELCSHSCDRLRVEIEGLLKDSGRFARTI